jgi:small-conductance mechanosensitive channel
MRLSLSFLAIAFVVSISAFSQAQDNGSLPVDKTESQNSISQVQVDPAIEALAVQAEKELETVRSSFEQITALLQNNDLSRNELLDIRNRAEAAKARVDSVIETLQPRLQDALRQLEELKPSETESELIPTDTFVLEEAVQKSIVSRLDAVQRTAQVINFRAQEILDSITERIRDLFSQRLFDRSHSILSPSLWGESWAALPVFVKDFLSLLFEGWALVATTEGQVAGGLIIVFLAIIIGIATPLRRRLLGMSRRRNDIDPTNLQKVSAGLWTVFVNLSIPAAVLFLVYLIISNYAGLLPNRLKQLYIYFSIAFLFMTMLLGLQRAILSPYKAKWRLMPIRDGAAEKLVLLLSVAGIFYAINLFISRAISIVSASSSLSIFFSGLINIFIAVFLLFSLKILMSGLSKSDDKSKSISLFLWRWLIPLGWVLLAGVIISAISGYIVFADFLIRQVIWTLVIFSFLYLFLNFIEEISDTIFNESSYIGQRFHKDLGFSNNGIHQFGIILSGILKILLVVLSLFLVLAPFGLESRDFVSSIKHVFIGFQLGSISISPISIAAAILFFIVGLFLTRSFQSWLDKRYLPHTSLDDGLKISIRTAIGYVGIVFAAIVGFSYLGLNLENIAIVAGALSVGIGFGLQSIVSNFVSGLILLAERPFKAGDWIVVAGEQGIVKKVSVRATEIETFDRATIIVPNSDFISGTVKNWVHNTTLGRVIVPIGVSYKEDPEEVRRLLLEVVREHPLILSEPEPRIFFTDFGASSLDFQVYAYLSDIGTGLSVRSDLRYSIFKKLRDAGIEIPFPQQDIHFRDISRIEDFLNGFKK